MAKNEWAVEDEPTADGGIVAEHDRYIFPDGKSKSRVTHIIGEVGGGRAMYSRLNQDQVEASANRGKELHGIAKGMMSRFALTRVWPSPDTIRLIGKTAGWPDANTEWAVRLGEWAGLNIVSVAIVERLVVGDIFAGTVDLVATMSDGKTAIVDWKTGSPSNSHFVQLSAYADGLKTTVPDLKIQRRLVVYIPAKGGKLSAIADTNGKFHDKVWQGMKTVWTWRGMK